MDFIFPILCHTSAPNKRSPESYPTDMSECAGTDVRGEER